MQILTVDVGTGTQDIYLFRAGLRPENGFKLVMPSPTMLIRHRIQKATRKQEAVLLTGVMMGGGPCQWATEEHLRAGLRVFATPDAARTFNDDLEWVKKEMGVELLSDEEADQLSNVARIQMKDFDFSTIRATFQGFGVDLKPDAVAVAVFDHGAAPPGVSDRQFRFDYLKNRIQAENRLTAFGYTSDNIPQIMTRMQAVAATAGDLDCPLLLMDTAPAAVLGSLLDPTVASRERILVANVGNFHTLAFRLGPEGIEGLFEHHTGLLDATRLDALLLSLAESSLTHESVFVDHGHGALILNPDPLPIHEDSFNVAVTGPRRAMLRKSKLAPYFSVPFGDMMLTGCFGLLVAVADLLPDLAQPILSALQDHEGDIAPWDVRD
jgi:uncharacterized protein (DUF1786 family)